MGFHYTELALAQGLLIIISIYWLLKRNDELPLLFNALLFYVTSYRYWIVNQGVSNWINLTRYGLSPVNNESAADALNYIVTGQIILIAVYMYKQTMFIPKIEPKQLKLNSFFKWIRPRVLTFGIICLPLSLSARSYTRLQYLSGKSPAFEINSYVSMLPMVLIGVATLILCVWKVGGMPNLLHKITAAIVLAGVVNYSFNISGRFQFIGWMATAGIILSSTYQPKLRLGFLTLSAAVGSIYFGIAGALRGVARGYVSSEELNTATWMRLFSAEDANMLDGFAMLKEAFTNIVPFRLGMAHLEILMRPIPRALWPEKPVGGGYLQQVGLIDPTTGSTLGFSPTVFGDFYSEGGLLGIIIFSVLYGLMFAYIVRLSVKLHPFSGLLVRAVLMSSMVPLLRGGDLPGIYSWIGMAFWPCFLVIWLRRKELSRNNFENTMKRIYSLK
ncbi:MAG: oligosaccharide repeat unit polymerase [Phormidesmis sp. RL_2_1]|nr:oligosaccharide repeat unit polymerase [Phormidesmis sp. RL_2_1]